MFKRVHFNLTVLLIKYFFWGIFIFTWGCSEHPSNQSSNKDQEQQVKIEKMDTAAEESKRLKEKQEEEKSISKIERTLIDSGLVNIQDIDSTLQVDVKYATTDNFMGKVLYPNYEKVYLQPEVAKRLAKAQKALQALDSNLTLLVFDGARPRSVQQSMWDAMDTIPFNERVNFLSNPANGSVHNYGCAVDLTIKDKTTGKWLDMGADYDDLRKIAYPRHEQAFLEQGKLTKKQLQNRKLLRRVMRAGGFYVIQTEWWHFNAFTRETAKERYSIIE